MSTANRQVFIGSGGANHSSSNVNHSTNARKSNNSVATNITTTATNNNNHRHQHFATNKIRTTKYTLLTFLPVSLFDQFRRFANIYFLAVAVLQIIPEVSLTNGLPTIILPLSFVLLVTMIKEGYEDYWRYKSDNEINHRFATVYRNNQWVQIMWKRILVGDIVKIVDGEFFPGDTIFLASSDPLGVCFVETKNLDGETNLKPRNCAVKGCADVTQATGVIEVELPNKNLTCFEGWVRLEDAQGLEGQYPLTIHNILLRGTLLKNTEWVMGVIVYTGRETKVMMNATDTPSKRSDVEHRTNPMIAVTFTAQVLCAAGMAVAGFLWARKHKVDMWYLGDLDTAWDTIIFDFLSGMLLLSYMIPIAIYVSMETVKVVQGLFINWDIRMYYAGNDTPAVARTSTLNEELGHVQHIFSDKTGTLTCNVMRFSQCSIGGRSYGDAYDVASADQAGDIGIAKPLLAASSSPSSSLLAAADIQQQQQQQRNITSLVPGAAPNDDVHYKFYDREFLHHIQQEDSNPHTKAMRDFVLCLGLCHNVLVSWEEGDKGHPIYRATSPDEAALVNAARHLGYTVLNATRNEVRVQDLLQHRARDFDVLQMLEFDSARKRMTVIVREKGQKTIRMFSKGADSVMAKRLKRGQDEMLNKCQNHADAYARLGLRTLFVCVRDFVTDDQLAEYEDWNRKFSHASMLMSEREKTMNECMDEMERDLTLLGVTAVEDQLQDEVPVTIRKMQAANIKVWVLTGDKQETAIDIGFSCGLLHRGMTLRLLDGGDAKSVMEQMLDTEASRYRVRGLSTEVRSSDMAHGGVSSGAHQGGLLLKAPWMGITPSDGASKSGSSASILSKVSSFLGKYDDDMSESYGKFDDYEALESQAEAEIDGNYRNGQAVIVDGPTLAIIEEDESNTLQSTFVSLCNSSVAVVCCRMSPAQKAVVVKMVRDNCPGQTTLAIGDGANDVPMIQSAHVGVGISGYEGLQAVCSSDYAIAQFQFLQRLLLVHGRWSYRRNAKLILYIFYKCFVYVTCLVWFAIYNGISMQQLYNEWAYQFYNTFFTSLPVLFMGALDQDVGDDNVLKYPIIYRQGQMRLLFNLKLFCLWCISGIWQSVLIFYICAYACDVFWVNGRPIGLWEMGTVVFNVVVLVVNIRIAMMTSYHTWLNQASILVSIAAWILFMLVITSFVVISPLMYGDMVNIMTSPSFYLVSLIATFAALFRDWTWRCIVRLIFPNPVHTVQERERIPKLASQLFDGHPKSSSL